MLYAALVLEPEILGWLILDCRLLGVKPIRLQVDADYKLKDVKKIYKELEMKGKGYKKKLDDLHNDLSKQMEQIQKDLVDSEKLQATLEDESLAEACDLRKGLEMVALIEAQLKEMNPNLDSISEYGTKVSLYNERVADPNSVTQQRDDVKRQYDEWRKKSLWLIH